MAFMSQIAAWDGSPLCWHGIIIPYMGMAYVHVRRHAWAVKWAVSAQRELDAVYAI